MTDREVIGRDDVVEYLRRHLIGPFDGPAEKLTDPPSYRYTMGVLYPRNAALEVVTSEEELDDAGGGVAGELTDDPVASANQFLPASVGLSFHFQGDPVLRCEVRGAAYSQEDGRRSAWDRTFAHDEGSPETVELTDSQSARPVLGGRASVSVRWRRLAGGWLVTVTLVNTAEAEVRRLGDSKDCLFQVGLRCGPVNGRFVEYPRIEGLTLGEEDEEIRLLYRGEQTWAIGHGCGAVWEERDGEVVAVRTDFMPAVEVPPVIQRTDGRDVLRLGRLADPGAPNLVEDLRAFIGEYRSWIDGLVGSHADVPPALAGAQDRILSRLRQAADRMLESVELLDRDTDIRAAFHLANRAMLMQMERPGPESRGPAGDERVPLENDWTAETERRWFPFQLAYILLTLPSVADPDAVDRDLVDLLWFPTGGGKTEAYLAVAAIAILLRRMRDPVGGGGTTVVTRYTLRLLTAQQFQRAARLVCALELLRRAEPRRFGEQQVSIGLWVGEDTPNKYSDAVAALKDTLAEDEPKNRFQLEACPWCATPILPSRRSDRRQDYGITATNTSFAFNCPEPSCAFHERLPVGVVDEGLYDHPPTVIIGTVDKFARIAWLERPGVFFGATGNRPPSLIIQDELHLLSGPLGTTVGIYESAIEALCSLGGERPKILASTATIREADAQARSLFGRNVRLFPPSGLEAGDSFWSRIDRSARGRLYVGVMAPSHTPSTSVVRTCAVLAQGANEVALEPDELDAYWSLVVYHNSLRELGKTVTFARDDIPAWIDVIAVDRANRRRLDDENVLELTSNVSSPEIPGSLSRLFRTWKESGAVALLACTNMLSVGVDVPRLGLMVVNGQPKTTAEYIQASSRVGRGRVPGLVIAHFAATKPRDRSHYESFVPYHRSLYRWVEPTSVTPFALPSRVRALHAALVILVRHGAGLRANEDARLFRQDDPGVKRVLEELMRRVELSDPAEVGATRGHLQRLAREWEEWALLGDDERHPLHYRASRPLRTLLRDFGTSGDGWETLHSMRNVDRQCEVAVQGAR